VQKFAVPPFTALNLLTGPGVNGMNRNIGLTSFSGNKRVLIVSETCVDSDERSAYLRSRGFRVDCAGCAETAVRMSRTISYDLVVLTMDVATTRLAAELERLNPSAMVTCLADCKKPIPPLRCDRLLWTGEPLEYFAARVETLAATA
jgi:hypothetical protein